MNNKEFGKQMELRTKQFAIQILQLSSSLPNTLEFNVIKNQISKSGTSIGANYREANRSRSRADFLNKIKICEGETNETIYWLEIISEFNEPEKTKIMALIKEAKEFLGIFIAIGNKIKSNITTKTNTKRT